MNVKKSVVIPVLVTSLLIQSSVTYGSTISDLKEEKNELKQEINQLNKSMKENSDELQSNKSEQKQIIQKLEAIGESIRSKQDEIQKVEANIQKSTEAIDKLKEQISQLEKKIENRDELLRERARAIQANGSISYLDVLLGANSFTDFIDRISAVTTLIDADKQIMQDQKNDQKELKQQQGKLEKEKQKQVENKADLESLIGKLNQEKESQNELVKQLEAEEAKLQSEQEQLKEQYDDVVTLSKEVEAKFLAEQKRIAEIARQQSQKNPSSNGSVSDGKAPSVSAGSWTRPAAGRFTSGFGKRDIGPIGSKNHLGIDIANAIGTPVVSAADGVVSYVGTMNGYGNVVMVTHHIGGQQYTTTYAHLSGFNSSVGQSVSKGQQIARMGNTGNSTGPHLHFEVHVGSWNGSRSNAVNPLNYITL